MKQILYTVCASALILLAVGAPTAHTKSRVAEDDYYYCDVIDGPTKGLFTGEKPRGWKFADFDDESWSDCSFPLAENVVCSELEAYGPPGGPFPLNERIVTRNSFNLVEYPVEAKITIVADNFAKVFVNGVLVFTTPPADGCGEVSIAHEVYLAVDDTTPLVIGENIVAVNAQDAGVQSFLNVEMTVVQSSPCDAEPEPEFVWCEVIDGPTKALLTGERPYGWTAIDFNDDSWTDVEFPLGENVFCPELEIYGPPRGPFPLNQRIATRNKFFLDRYPVEAKITVVADNFARVFVNGVHVFTTPPGRNCDGVSIAHEVYLPLDDTTPLVGGENVVAVNALDAGVQSFLHVEMQLLSEQQCDSY